jgi:ribosomal protein L37AE/L43A
VSADDSACPECGSRVTLGYEVQGIYDGVLYWVCGECGHARPRFTENGYRLTQVSIDHAERHNEQARQKGD